MVDTKIVASCKQIFCGLGSTCQIFVVTNGVYTYMYLDYYFTSILCKINTEL